MKATVSGGQFGAPYAVLNISKLGFRYFRIGFQLSASSLPILTEKFKLHPNVGWIFTTEGWCNLVIGIFAHDNAQINDISSSIRSELQASDTIVFQSELTSLYGFGNRPMLADANKKAMPIIDAIYQPLDFSPLELDYIKLLTMDSAVASPEMAAILSITEEKLCALKNSLEERGVIVGYQDRIDYGPKHWKVFIDTSSKRADSNGGNIVEALWSDARCIYVERANAKYDLEFELVLDSEADLSKYTESFETFQVIQFSANVYTNLYPLSKTANLVEIKKAVDKQVGNVVDLRESKLWYLNYQGAQGYLNIYDHREYFETMEKSELDLFDQLVVVLKSKYPNTLFHVIDIGSGNGMKGRIFIEKLGEKNIKAYYPVDIQPIELAAALNAHKGSKYAIHPTLLDFESLASRFPLKLLPGEIQIFLFLGGTYGNYPSKVINSYMKPLLSQSSALFIAMPLRAAGKTDQEIISSYMSASVEDVAFGPLTQIGFEKKDFARNAQNPELHVMPVLEDGRLVTTLQLKNDVKVLERTFTKGTTFKFTTSWKPSLPDVRVALESDFTVEEMFHNQDMSLTLITKLK